MTLLQKINLARLSKKVSIVVATTIFSIILPTTPSLAGGPSGSFSRTCENIRYNSVQVSAVCKTRNGSYISTRLSNWDRCYGGIENINGKLTCRNWINGSFSRTCIDIKVNHIENGVVSLSARCRTINGAWIPTKLSNIHDCDLERGLVNINGRLRCA